ncbi:uncharacterized protein PAC_16932 [Phialocephala subalpina]|uniref:Uncharacterized protein n=1 Tax=Phialocephala subalpina TaxID=576137 RepID=A0A1L7XPT7_9HELO|nr:uncharacterized protein PAC_16932 [Phialocephala subalpina]
MEPSATFISKIPGYEVFLIAVSSTLRVPHSPSQGSLDRSLACANHHRNLAVVLHCKRTASGCCLRCIYHLSKDFSDNANVIRQAEQFHKAVVYELLHQGFNTWSLSTLDLCGIDSGTLTLRIHPPIGAPLRLDLPLGGPFTTQNVTVIQPLDKFIEEHFSATLRGKKAECQLIDNASLAGGYLCFLCATTVVAEVVQTARDGINVFNEFNAYNLEAHFRYILVCRLFDLMSGTLEATEPQVASHDEVDWSSDAYSAAAVLHCELNYFTESLQHGLLRHNFLPDLKKTLLGWFQSVDRDLYKKLSEGCLLPAQSREVSDMIPPGDIEMDQQHLPSTPLDNSTPVEPSSYSGSLTSTPTLFDDMSFDDMDFNNWDFMADMSPTASKDLDVSITPTMDAWAQPSYYSPTTGLPGPFIGEMDYMTPVDPRSFSASMSENLSWNSLYYV